MVWCLDTKSQLWIVLPQESKGKFGCWKQGNKRTFRSLEGPFASVEVRVASVTEAFQLLQHPQFFGQVGPVTSPSWGRKLGEERPKHPKHTWLVALDCFPCMDNLLLREGLCQESSGFSSQCSGGFPKILTKQRAPIGIEVRSLPLHGQVWVHRWYDEAGATGKLEMHHILLLMWALGSLDHLDLSFDIGKVVSHFLNLCIWSSKLLWSCFEHFYQARTRRRLSSLDVARRVWTRRSWNEGGSWRPGTTCQVSATQGLNMRDSGCDVSYALRKDQLIRS